MRRLDFVDKVPMPTIRYFTLAQLLILGAIFTITRFQFIDGFFPFLIAILVPVRIWVLPKIFGAANVDAMDAVGTAPEEADAEAPKGDNVETPTQAEMSVAVSTTTTAM